MFCFCLHYESHGSLRPGYDILGHCNRCGGRVAFGHVDPMTEFRPATYEPLFKDQKQFEEFWATMQEIIKTTPMPEIVIDSLSAMPRPERERRQGLLPDHFDMFVLTPNPKRDPGKMTLTIVKKRKI